MPRISEPGSLKAPPIDSIPLSDDQKEALQSYHEGIVSALDFYASTYGISDWKKCKPLEWRGFCLYVGKNVFSDKTPLKEVIRASTSATITNNNAYDIKMLSCVYDIYTDLCYSVPGLPCRAFDFSAFVGIAYQTLANLMGRVTTAGIELAEKITHEQENSIAMAGEGGRINITMALAWNNHFHGWTQAREIIHRDGGAALDSGSWKSRFLGDSGQEKPGISTQDAPLLPENVEE